MYSDNQRKKSFDGFADLDWYNDLWNGIFRRIDNETLIALLCWADAEESFIKKERDTAIGVIL